ncbi:TetR/AcrR family transcriptional regulator [Ottowia thiooxydans]|uniref:AcrR family transcriptional regulator n=1 Tax=Ottowia thiooxydans TaxID=219182 RepID=A0ABV2Q8B7_9BURK
MTKKPARTHQKVAEAAPAPAVALARGIAKPQRRTGSRAAAAEATREAILRAATKVFAKYGYAGGSVEKISSAAKSVDRMIYYYFGSKEGLFIAVLEDIYRRMDEAESKLALDEAKPLEALAELILFVTRYYRDHPEFVTLLNTENLHKGSHIAKSSRAREYSHHAVTVTARLLAGGVERGLIRPGIDARQLYLLIAAAGYFHTSNRYTLGAFLGEAIDTPAALKRWEEFVIDSVLRIVRATP